MTHRSRLLAAALTAVAWLVVAVPGAGAHGANPSGALGVEGLSESRLRTWEERVLGDAHAREHALQREFARQPGARAKAAREARRARARARASVDGPADQIGRWNGRFDIP